ncbi:diaminopimelate decarboxylase [Microscilla marina]|uniref:Diaminopimelate decarboxylase n=1 Tax=Microscilla marina ATCC 23134 TaxID=313606 RepID=A1ZVN5_MICM2|nr:diaminopimelate decarboxylase [Microscilla marina]EAY25578.1 diaminopimelate decarboxylase [Microscilla marina ATCC 23134]
MELVDGRYQIQGVDVLDICQKFDTPLYVYDAEKMATKLNMLKDAFKGLNLKIKYAAKALTNVSVLKFLRTQGVGLDVVSIQEAHLGLKTGFKPEEILFTPNCVSLEEIKMAVELGLVINIDNISILEQFGHAYGDSVPCCIRINPHLMAGGNANISVGHIDSKFGVSILQARHLLRVIKTNNIKVTGLHMHTGSDILDAEVFLRGADILFDLAQDLPDLEFVDFGSGFRVAYKEGDVTTDIVDLGKKLTVRFKEFCKDYGRELEIWFEPGKFLVSEAGHFLMKTNVIKTTPATVFVGVDSGFNHLIRPMMYDSHHTIFNVSNPNSETTRVYTVVGYICETDTFGWDRKLNEVREGDIIALKNAGAYGFSMASNYNSRFRPAEVLVHNGKAHLIRKRETMDDILRNQVMLDFEAEKAEA